MGCIRSVAAAGLLVAAIAGPATATAATHVIVIEGMRFQPAALELKAGDTVTWENRDAVPHTATAARLFDSGGIAPGRRWSWKARGSGRIVYVCTYHPGMQANLELAR